MREQGRELAVAIVQRAIAGVNQAAVSPVIANPECVQSAVAEIANALALRDAEQPPRSDSRDRVAFG